MFKVLLPELVAAVIQDGRGAEIERETGARLQLGTRTSGIAEPESEPSTAERKEEFRELDIQADTGPVLRSAIRRTLMEVERIVPIKAQDGSGAPHIAMKVVIPRWLASMIIGFRGATIRDICRNTKTVIHIEERRPGMDDSEAAEQIANITGPGKNTLSVFERIHQYGQDSSNGSQKTACQTEEVEAVAKVSDGVANEEGRPPTPPPPWRLEEHPQAPGEWYYLNTATGETTWELPTEDCDDAADEVRGTRPPTPPRPWKTMEHPQAPGEWYYLNEVTGETCWDLPDNVSNATTIVAGSAGASRDVPAEIQLDSCRDNAGDTSSIIDVTAEDAPMCEEEAMVDDRVDAVDDIEGTNPALPAMTTEAEVMGLIDEAAAAAARESVHPKE